MRIIAGELKGRKFAAGRRPNLRPTGDRVREAIFSVLQSDYELSGWKVLDLYAGSGSLGLEALSRGAAVAVFVDSDREFVSELSETCSDFELGQRAKIIRAEIPKLFQSPPSQLLGQAPFDLVFADPPYSEHPGMQLADELERTKLVRQGSILVVESSRREPLASGEPNSSPVLLKEKIYGDTRVSFFCFQ